MVTRNIKQISKNASISFQHLKQ